VTEEGYTANDDDDADGTDSDESPLSPSVIPTMIRVTSFSAFSRYGSPKYIVIAFIIIIIIIINIIVINIIETTLSLLLALSYQYRYLVMTLTSLLVPQSTRQRGLREESVGSGEREEKRSLYLMSLRG
jgi:hypothetical protein